MRNMLRTLGAALLVLPLLAAARPATAQSLTGAGATFPYPIYSKWFDLYHAKTGVEINYQSIGSGAGIQQVKAGTVDFGASDAALSNDRLKELPRKVVHFPTVAGALAMVYNLPGFTAQLKLTPDAIVGIYMGKITLWNDAALAAANPGVTLPGVPILVVHRSDGSGTTNIFTTYL
jgi:phosphate transport system substrate-binding protein